MDDRVRVRIRIRDMIRVRVKVAERASLSWTLFGPRSSFFERELI